LLEELTLLMKLGCGADFKKSATSRRRVAND